MTSSLLVSCSDNPLKKPSIETISFDASIQEDATFSVYNKLQNSSSDGSIITFEKGVYHFYPEHAYEKFCYISNHNDVLTRIGFMLKDKQNVTIDGNGSTFIFHGRIIPFLIENCNNIQIKNLTIDFAESFHSEAKVVANNSKEHTFDLNISTEYPYEIRNNQLYFIKPYYHHTLGQSILYDPNMEAIAFNTETYTPITTIGKVKERFQNKPFEYKYKTDLKDSYIFDYGRQCPVQVKQIKPGIVRVYNHKKALPPVGLILASKGEQNENRFAPAFKVNATKKIYAENVKVHHAGGMGFIFENCTDVDLYKCEISPSGNRMVSTTADATHFVGCRGKVSLRNCVFRNQLDDASNIHGAYQEIMDIIDKRTIGLRVGHFQQLGFQLAFTGDTIGFVRLSDSFDAYDKAIVENIEMVNGRYQIIHLKGDIPTSVKPGDLVENLTAYPELLVENCLIKGNRARGLLVSTPKKTLIRNNIFNTEMEAILMPVESGMWFESGNATNVTIEGNTFQDCSYGGLNRGAIRFHTDEKNKNIAFRNIHVNNNKFNQFDNLIMQISNVDGLVFENNIITNSGTYPQLYPENPAFSINYSTNIEFKNNNYNGKASKIVDCQSCDKIIKFN